MKFLSKVMISDRTLPKYN